ncbi:MAG: TRAP transporter substrate-binding protein DctP [Pseudomonadota bacterium]
MKTQKSCIALITALVLTSVFAILPAASVLAKTFTLSYVSFVPLANKVEFQLVKKGFIDKVNERAKGELVINVRGGPEVIHPFELGVSVQRGVIDYALIPTAFFENLVPAADSTKLSIYTADEERKNGVYEYILEMYKKSGLYYLGRHATDPAFFFLFMNKRVEKPEDFKGLKLGGSTAFHGFYQELGCALTTLPIPEYHSAMERGVVDGLTSSLYVALQFGLQDVTKYVISPGFYRATPAHVINLNTWNSLPKHLQQLMTDCMAEFEKEYVVLERKERILALEKWKESGREIIELSPEVAAWYLKAASEGSWKYAEKRFPGDVAPRLRERITK